MSFTLSESDRKTKKLAELKQAAFAYPGSEGTLWEDLNQKQTEMEKVREKMDNTENGAVIKFSRTLSSKEDTRENFFNLNIKNLKIKFGLNPIRSISKSFTM